MTVADVDALIARHRLQGETLQQALTMKAVVLTMEERPGAALDAMAELIAAQNSRSEFDRGDYLPVTDDTIAILNKRVAEGEAGAGNAAAYLALHRMFENQEVPSRYKISCHATETSAFEPNIALRKPIANGYGELLLETTAGLQGEARATALGKGLEDTAFLNEGAIRTIITQTIPQLVGAENAASYLPERYRSWVRPRSRPRSDQQAVTQGR